MSSDSLQPIELKIVPTSADSTYTVGEDEDIGEDKTVKSASDDVSCFTSGETHVAVENPISCFNASSTPKPTGDDLGACLSGVSQKTRIDSLSIESSTAKKANKHKNLTREELKECVKLEIVEESKRSQKGKNTSSETSLCKCVSMDFATASSIESSSEDITVDDEDTEIIVDILEKDVPHERGLEEIDEHLINKNIDNNEELLEGNKISHPKFKKSLQKILMCRRIYRRVALKCASSQEEVDKIGIAEANDVPKHQEKILEATGKLAENAPETTEEEFNDLVEAATDHALAQQDEILDECKRGIYSDKAINKILDICENNIDTLINVTQEFLDKFWNSSTGQAIKAYTRSVMEDFKKAKKEYIEAQETVEKAKIAAEQAQKVANKANEEVKRLKQKAEDIANNKGFRDLNSEQLKFVLKKESTSAYVDYLWAEDKQKKAYWAQWDAESAKRLADNQAALAAREMAMQNARAFAAMAMAQSYFA